MKSVKILFDYICEVLNLLFEDDSLISKELIEIMNNEEDKKKYFEAIEKSRISNTVEIVKLSSGKTLYVNISNVTIIP